MSEQVFQLISEVSKKSVEELKASQNDTGLWDSLLHVELVFALEAEFDIFFSPDEIAEIDTPAKIVEILQLKVA